MKGMLSLNMTRTRRLNSRVISLCLTAAILLTALIGKYLLWSSQSVPTIDEVPEFSGKPYVEINDNKPKFNEKDKKRKAFERYSDLDKLGRCGTAYAKIGKELMPSEKRESISHVRPSGWKSTQYRELIKDRFLYNRCHLIGFQLAGENANPKNLITGTRYLNIEGMFPFEDKVTKYIKRTGNHVMYRVKPIFKGKDLIARGVQMEGESIEDGGKAISFNVFVYNCQPGVKIDYATGGSKRKN